MRCTRPEPTDPPTTGATIDTPANSRPLLLADFIADNLEPIRQDWEQFAESLEAGRALSPAALRDHARGILTAVVDDMRQTQSLQTQAAKGRGQMPGNSPDLREAAETHALTRLSDQFTRSALRMSALIGDLLDYTSARLAQSLPVNRTQGDLLAICTEAMAELSAAHPGRRLYYQSSGDTVGNWDGARIGQRLTNLVGNALFHGAAGEAVTVTVSAGPDTAVIEVHNDGQPIPPSKTAGLFEPFKITGKTGGQQPLGSSGLGLGLSSRPRSPAPMAARSKCPRRARLAPCSPSNFHDRRTRPPASRPADRHGFEVGVVRTACSRPWFSGLPAAVA